MKKTVLSVAAAAAFAAAASSAFAGSIQLTEQSITSMGRSYAGAGIVGDDLSAVWYNPAGMTLLRGTAIQAGGAFAFLDFPVTAYDGTSDNGRKHGVPIPSGYFVHQINPSMWFGIGLTVPFGLATEYDKHWALSALGANAEVKVFDLNPSVAWKVTDKISFGVGVSIQYGKVYLENGLTDYAAYGYTGTGRYKGDSWAIGADVGVMWEPTERLRFGLSYRSKLTHDTDGRLKLSESYSLLAKSLLGKDTFSSGVSITAPAMAMLTGVWEATDRLTLSFLVRWTDWSSMDVLSIEDTETGTFSKDIGFHYRDAWQLSLGADYRINSSFTVRGGVGYEESPARSEYRIATVPDGNHFLFSVGGTWHATDRLQLDAAVQYFRGVGNKSLYSPGTRNELGRFSDIESWLFGAQFVYRLD